MREGASTAAGGGAGKEIDLDKGIGKWYYNQVAAGRWWQGTLTTGK